MHIQSGWQCLGFRDHVWAPLCLPWWAPFLNELRGWHIETPFVASARNFFCHGNGQKSNRFKFAQLKFGLKYLWSYGLCNYLFAWPLGWCGRKPMLWGTQLCFIVYVIWTLWPLVSTSCAGFSKYYESPDSALQLHELTTTQVTGKHRQVNYSLNRLH